ncbi:MAG TPA: putative sulfate exporter family transporter [Gemmatimonadaceae bacterium]|nr:putative sulfate exporter family transporter [Gemmatimonadaceae bacterium]
MLVVLVAFAAQQLGAWEVRALGRLLVDPLVIAIFLGMLVRAALGARAALDAGIDFAAKDVLEVAVVLLGASVNLAMLRSAGLPLALGLLGFVTLALIAGIAIGRAFGLTPRLSVLIAAGNAICGNSAIAAVAPSIGARREETASAVAFTALLGMVAVIALPFLMEPLGLSHEQFGVLAGSTVYAVPQVLAAAYPVSDAAGEMATLVKLTRVLLLGPMVLIIAAWWRRRHADAAGLKVPRVGLPWFIVGFAALAVLRATGLLSVASAELAADAAHRLTLAAMAGLGLSVDLREVRRVGAKAALTASAGLLLLVLLGLGLAQLL